jgi:hypothetical protein
VGNVIKKYLNTFCVETPEFERMIHATLKKNIIKTHEINKMQ